tara:strand:- start:2832 stop:3548 length:717 start_codon:yes stop_codon:yes gene_type:complete
MVNKFVILLPIAVIVVLVIVILIMKMVKANKFAFWNKGSSKTSNMLIDKEMKTDFEKPLPNMKFSYKFDLRVYYTGSAREIHVICDRKSPIIRLDMTSGRLLIDYLAPVVTPYQGPPDSEPAEPVETTAPPVDQPDETVETCVCPTQPPNDSTDETAAALTENYPTTMRVATPAIPFQTVNTIEIQHNLREVDVFVNGEIFYSALLDYVPFLFRGNGRFLTNDAHKYMTLNNFTYRNM